MIMSFVMFKVYDYLILKKTVVPKVLIGYFEHLSGKVLIFIVLKIRYKKSLPLYNICDKSITIIN